MAVALHPLFGDSPVPRYAQLADVLRGRIARGQWRTGDQLPTLDELTQEFDVARVTVRQAIELLAREGLLSAQQGRGTFVTGVPSGLERPLRLQTTLLELADPGPVGQELRGPEAFKQANVMYSTAFPDFRLDIDLIIAEGAYVMVYGPGTGTFSGSDPPLARGWLAGFAAPFRPSLQCQ